MGNMNWKKLFAARILERGYDYYCNNAVDFFEASACSISAEVIGTDTYEVEIYFEDGDISDMYCSCPYAEDGNYCKHMAAVLYKWSEESESDDCSEDSIEEGKDIFLMPDTKDEYMKKTAAVRNLVEKADDETVRSYLTSVLMENEKLLVRFNSIVKKQTTEEDVGRFTAQVDNIADFYLGRNHYISYYEAYDFIFELEEILDVDVRRMMDNEDYISAFRLASYIFEVVGNVDIDDSGGGTGMLADKIYLFWLELLAKVDIEKKKYMFSWFTGHLDGTIIDYLEDYIEKIIMDEFREDEFMQPKLKFIEKMIERSTEKDSEWSRNYYTGKWAERYLGIIEKQENSDALIEEFCRKYWENSSVRKYYIEYCMGKRDYVKALEVLDESISMDSKKGGLISEYSIKKKEIFSLQGNRDAYMEQLWKLVLEDDAGDMDIYKELKAQYTAEEWTEKREEIFIKLPKDVRMDCFYEEEKLYDRLLDFVMQSSGLYALQQYENVLKNEYPEQLLEKYKTEVNNMALYSGNRKKYEQITALLRRMKKIKGGPAVVEDIVSDWTKRYRNRPAMMDELRKL